MIKAFKLIIYHSLYECQTQILYPYQVIIFDLGFMHRYYTAHSSYHHIPPVTVQP